MTLSGLQITSYYLEVPVSNHHTKKAKWEWVYPSIPMGLQAGCLGHNRSGHSDGEKKITYGFRGFNTEHFT